MPITVATVPGSTFARASASFCTSLIGADRGGGSLLALAGSGAGAAFLRCADGAAPLAVDLAFDSAAPLEPPDGAFAAGAIPITVFLDSEPGEGRFVGAGGACGRCDADGAGEEAVWGRCAADASGCFTVAGT